MNRIKIPSINQAKLRQGGLPAVQKACDIHVTKMVDPKLPQELRYRHRCLLQQCAKLQVDILKNLNTFTLANR